MLFITTGNIKAAPERLLDWPHRVILCSYQWRKQSDSCKHIALYPQPFLTLQIESFMPEWIYSKQREPQNSTSYLKTLLWVSSTASIYLRYFPPCHTVTSGISRTEIWSYMKGKGCWKRLWKTTFSLENVFQNLKAVQSCWLFKCASVPSISEGIGRWGKWFPRYFKDTSLLLRILLVGFFFFSQEGMC